MLSGLRSLVPHELGSVILPMFSGDGPLTSEPIEFRSRSTGGPPVPPVRPPSAPAGFHVMAKPTGAICNLDCSYCFYLSKAALYPGVRSRMTDDVMEIYIRQLIESHVAPQVTIAWQGGEPTLMGLSFFERAVEIAERYRRPGQHILHTIQTNATLLDATWGAFLSKHHFLVGVSLDGPPACHDAYRVDKRGRPTSDRVLQGLGILRLHRVNYNILCTVHAANVADPVGVYRYLRDECGGNSFSSSRSLNTSRPSQTVRRSAVGP